LSASDRFSYSGLHSRSHNPQDADLLVVYEPSELPPAKAAAVRGVMVRACAEAAVHPLIRCPTRR